MDDLRYQIEQLTKERDEALRAKTVLANATAKVETKLLETLTTLQAANSTAAKLRRQLETADATAADLRAALEREKNATAQAIRERDALQATVNINAG